MPNNSNTTNISNANSIYYKEDTTVSVTTVILLVIALAVSILNISCLVVLAKDKKLKERRFNMLTICLSISDATTGLLSSVLSLRTIYFNLSGSTLPPFCFISISLISTTILFSLLQTLWICIERLLATFPTITNPCKNVSVIAINVALFIFCGLYIIPVNLVYGNVWSDSCSLNAIFGKDRIQVLSIIQPVYLLTVIAIVVVYSCVIFRIYRSWKRIYPITGTNLQRRNNLNLTGTSTKMEDFSTVNSHQYQCTEHGTASTSAHGVEKNRISNNGVQRIRSTAITLGLLIVIMLLSVLPKVILGLAVINNPYSVPLQTALGFSDFCLYLNPLLDPIIYVLRIKSFRNRLRCRSDS